MGFYCCLIFLQVSELSEIRFREGKMHMTEDNVEYFDTSYAIVIGTLRDILVKLAWVDHTEFKREKI